MDYEHKLHKFTTSSTTFEPKYLSELQQSTSKSSIGLTNSYDPNLDSAIDFDPVTQVIREKLEAQPPTKPNLYISNSFPNAPIEKTDDISTNLDFTSNYDSTKTPTTTMAATESNDLAQEEKNHSQPSGIVQHDEEKSSSTPLHELKRTDKTFANQTEFERNSDSQPQSETNEEQILDSAPRTETNDINKSNLETNEENEIDLTPTTHTDTIAKEKEILNGELITTQSTLNIFEEIEKCNRTTENPQNSRLSTEVDQIQQLVQLEKNHSQPLDEVYQDKRKSSATPSPELHQTDKTFAYTNEFKDISDSQSPTEQSPSETNDINKSNLVTNHEIEPDLTPMIHKTTIAVEKEEFDGKLITTQSTENPQNSLHSTEADKTQQLEDNPLIVTISEEKETTHEISNTTQIISSIFERIANSCNKSMENHPATQINLIDVQSQTETNQEDFQPMTNTNLSREPELQPVEIIDRSTAKPNVLSIFDEIANSCSERVENLPTSPNCSHKNTTEPPKLSDQSKSTEQKREKSTTFAMASPEIDTKPTESVRIILTTPSFPVTINDAHIQETSTPKSFVHTEHMDGANMANPTENVITPINRTVKKSNSEDDAVITTSLTRPPPPSPPPTLRTNPNDNTNESTGDKITAETDKSSGNATRITMNFSIKLILLLVCAAILVSNNF